MTTDQTPSSTTGDPPVAPAAGDRPEMTAGRGHKPAIITGMVALAAGVVVGAAVAVAMHRDRGLYLRFIGVAGIAAVIVIAVTAYRTYVHPSRDPVADGPNDRSVRATD